jgi:Fe-S-cluster containining protein
MPAPLACRPGCGACCIAPSLTAPTPGFPAGKLAGVPCGHLTDDLRCAIFGSPDRPAVCNDLRPQPEMCGDTRDEALATLTRWEELTRP